MIRKDSVEKVTCLHCGYSWFKRMAGRPKCCPECKNRAYDKAVNIDDDSQRTASPGFNLFGHGEAVIVCPVCKDYHVKIKDVLKYSGTETVILELLCEEGHRVDLHLNYVGGSTVCELVKLGDGQQ